MRVDGGRGWTGYDLGTWLSPKRIRGFEAACPSGSWLLPDPEVFGNEVSLLATCGDQEICRALQGGVARTATNGRPCFAYGAVMEHQ